MTTVNILPENVKEVLFKFIDDDLTFVDAPKNLLCCVCGLVPIFHHISSCNHLYCRDCFVWFQQRNKKCKQCRAVIGTKSSQSKEVELAIYKLKVVCVRGCKDDVFLADLLDHLDECRFVTCEFGKDISEIEQTTKGSSGNTKELKKSIADLEKKFNTLLESNRQVLAQNKQLLLEKNDDLVKKYDATLKELAKINERGNDRDIISKGIADLNNKLQRLSKDFDFLKKHVFKIEMECKEGKKGDTGLFTGTYRCIEKDLEEWIHSEVRFGQTCEEIEWLVSTIDEVTISQRNEVEFIISNANFVFFTKSDPIAFQIGKTFSAVDWKGDVYECLCTLDDRTLTMVITWSEHQDIVVWELHENELIVVGTCPNTPYSLKYQKK